MDFSFLGSTNIDANPMEIYVTIQVPHQAEFAGNNDMSHQLDGGKGKGKAPAIDFTPPAPIVVAKKSAKLAAAAVRQTLADAPATQPFVLNPPTGLDNPFVDQPPGVFSRGLNPSATVPVGLNSTTYPVGCHPSTSPSCPIDPTSLLPPGFQPSTSFPVSANHSEITFARFPVLQTIPFGAVNALTPASAHARICTPNASAPGNPVPE